MASLGRGECHIEPAEELSGLVGIGQRVLRECRPVDVPHYDSDPASAQRSEHVLVGQVVPQADRTRAGKAQTHTLEQPEHGLTFVPAVPRAKFVHQLAPAKSQVLEAGSHSCTRRDTTGLCASAVKR